MATITQEVWGYVPHAGDTIEVVNDGTKDTITKWPASFGTNATRCTLKNIDRTTREITFEYGRKLFTDPISPISSQTITGQIPPGGHYRITFPNYPATPLAKNSVQATGMPNAFDEVVEKRHFAILDTSGAKRDVIELYVRHVPGVPGHLDHCDANMQALIKAYGKDSYFDLVWRGTNYNWHSFVMEVSRFDNRARTIEIGGVPVGQTYWFKPDALVARTADGNCPRCNTPGEFIRMALCCPKHGAFGGL